MNGKGLVSQIDPKKELKFWTTLIIVLLSALKCKTHPKPSNETIGFFVAFSLLKKANNFWHSGDKSDFLPILQNMQNITIIDERNA
jgi:hypothetical protein